MTFKIHKTRKVLYFREKKYKTAQNAVFSCKNAELKHEKCCNVIMQNTICVVLKVNICEFAFAEPLQGADCFRQRESLMDVFAEEIEQFGDFYCIFCVRVIYYLSLKMY